jgi:hypothetical protein
MSSTTTTMAPCKYGIACYRKDPEHKKNYSHPDDSNDDVSLQPQLKKAKVDGSSSTTSSTHHCGPITRADDREDCKYGAACYRKGCVCVCVFVKFKCCVFR